MAGLGSDSVSLKGDADEEAVELSIGDDTYTRTRENGVVATDSDLYIDDPTIADLFAFLLESNEARLAIARSDDFCDLIMRRIDTGVIRAEISELENRRRELDDRLGELEESIDVLHDERAELEDDDYERVTEI